MFFLNYEVGSSYYTCEIIWKNGWTGLCQINSGPRIYPFTLHAQINVIEKNRFRSEKSRWQSPECPVTQDACFRDLHKILNNVLLL